MTRIEQHNGCISSQEMREGLALWLELAVPLAMAELAILPDAARATRIRVWLSDGARAVGANGDALMFTSRKPGRAEIAATGLAKGIAAEAALNGTATHFGLMFVWPGARPAHRDPDPDAEPGDAGEWYGTHRVETVQPAEEFL